MRIIQIIYADKQTYFLGRVSHVQHVQPLFGPSVSHNQKYGRRAQVLTKRFFNKKYSIPFNIFNYSFWSFSHSVVDI